MSCTTGQPCPLVLSEVRGTTQCEECNEARASPPFQRDSLHYRPPGRRQTCEQTDGGRRQTCEQTEALPQACNGAVYFGATRPQPLRGPLPGIAQGGPGVPASVERAPRKRGGLPCGPHVAIPWPQVASLGAPLVAVPRGSLRVVVPCVSGLAEAPRRPRREAPETAEACRGARLLINCRGELDIYY